MKKSLLLIAALALVSFTKAQSSFQITELISGNPAQSFYVHNTDTANHNSPMEVDEFKITNISGTTKKLCVKMLVLNNSGGAFVHDMFYCFNINCYPPTVTYSFCNLAAGASLPSGSGLDYGLRAEFEANLYPANSVVRYNLHDSLNPADSMHITISYNVASVTGIKNNSNNIFVSTPSPNPASNIINFNYDLGNADASIKIYNTLGNLVKTTSLNPTLKNTQVDVSTLEEGFYFYSVIANGKAISTKRLVIAR
jgi:hypothetical protein